MKLLIDTNVVLDVLLRREPFSEAAAGILKLAQRDDVREYVSASAITDIYYIVNRQMKGHTHEPYGYGLSSGFAFPQSFFTQFGYRFNRA